jgi:Transposase DDE domain
MDQYCALVLLFLFNPCLRSLRALQQASELNNVQRKLGCSRSSLGSLSEATDVFDPARLRQIIGELYRQRWTIEIFFRFYKHVLGCRHLLRTARAGIEIQTYMAIIAGLLLALWTGGKPTLRTYDMVCLYLQGWADEEELLAHLKKLKPHVA